MDYEKKYNEMVRRAKELHESGNALTRRQMEIVCPELTESEDEKIRKALLGLTYLDGIEPILTKCSITRNEIRAYLERQKEIPMPNSTELIEMWHKAKAILKEKDFRGDEWRLAQNAFMDGFARGTYVKFEKQEQKSTECELEDVFKYYTDAGIMVSCGDFVAKPKEQKPRKFKLGDKVHWQDDDTNVITITGFRDDAYLTDSAYGPILFSDEDNWERIEQKPAEWSEQYIAGIFEKVGLAKIVREQGNDDLTNALQNAMLELSKVENTEWSDEDKRAIDRACVALRAYSNGDLPEFLPSELLGYADRLQSLHPQPKQEWSEEDEEKLDDLINYFEGDTLDSSTEDMVAWLKSLRPQSHWKPSEEQLEALLNAEGLVRANNYPENAKILASLYEQLKKL